MLKRLTDHQGSLILLDPSEVIAISASVVPGCSAVRIRERQPDAASALYTVRGSPEEVAKALDVQ